MPGDPLRLHGRKRLPRLREQVPHHERRVTHHVVEHSTALQPAPPEPGRMRAAVLLRGAREVRPAGELGAPGPEQRAAHFHLWRKELVLEIARPESRPTRQPRHRLRLGDIPCQRLLACQPDQLAPAALDGIDDLLDVLDARMIGTAEPDGVNVGIGHHRLDRLVRRGCRPGRAHEPSAPWMRRCARSGSRRPAHRNRAPAERRAGETAR